MIDSRIKPHLIYDTNNGKLIMADYVQDILVGLIESSDAARRGVLRSSHRSRGLLLAGSFSPSVVRIMDIYEPDQLVEAPRVTFQAQPLKLLVDTLGRAGQEVVGLAKFDLYDGKAEIKIKQGIERNFSMEVVLRDGKSKKGYVVCVGSASGMILEGLSKKARFYEQGAFYIGESPILGRRRQA